MAIYTVHSRADTPDDPLFVKDGFSWPGFFFTLIWALAKRLWIVAAIIAAYLIATSIIVNATPQEDFWQFLASLVLGLVLGFEGNDLQRWSLARRGYAEIAVIEAQDLDEAELKFFAGRPAAPLATPPMQTPPLRTDPSAADPLGLFGSARS
jgi:hypothetical protein